MANPSRKGSAIPADLYKWNDTTKRREMWDGTTDTTEVSPDTLLNGQKTVTTAGIAEALATSTTVKAVAIKALRDNSGVVYIGDSSVSSTTGYVLNRGDAIGIAINDLASVYIDVDIDGDGVSYAAVD